MPAGNTVDRQVCQRLHHFAFCPSILNFCPPADHRLVPRELELSPPVTTLYEHQVTVENLAVLCGGSTLRLATKLFEPCSSITAALPTILPAEAPFFLLILNIPQTSVSLSAAPSLRTSAAFASLSGRFAVPCFQGTEFNTMHSSLATIAPPVLLLSHSFL